MGMIDRIRQRREERRLRQELGITVRDLLPLVKQLDEAGELDKMNDSAASVYVLRERVKQDPKVFGEVGIDIDQIQAWIEALMPLLRLLIALF